MAKTLTLREFREGLKSEKLVKAARAALVQTASTVLRDAIGNLQKEHHIDTGALVQSGRVRAVSPDHYRVSFDAPHASVVEFGRRPRRRRPPVAPIALWLVRKKGLDRQTAERVAFGLARKIGRRGIKPVRYFGRALKNAKRIFGAAFKKGGGK